MVKITVYKYGIFEVYLSWKIYGSSMVDYYRALMPRVLHDLELSRKRRYGL